jgi:2-polyprenyl-3-methyl-5-hydroxy-6-metoxy-1,4-benzoquinol methylase
LSLESPAQTTVPCPVCGATDDRTLHERADPGSGEFAAEMTTDVYASYGRIARCRRCGMAYRNPRETDEHVLSAYAALEDEDYLAERECRGMNALLSLKAVKRHVAQGRLLEIGCSTGFFLNAARLEFDCHGVEPSAWAARIARERFGLEVHTGPFETCHTAPASFDVVVLIDVLEHVLDPRALLARTASLLRPGGICYLVTPDISSLSARVLRRYWWGLRPAHLTYFAPPTLTRLLDETGLSVREIRSFGRIFTYGYWLSRLSAYPAAVRGGVGAAIRLLGWEDKVLYINTRDSMEVIAVRRED